MDSRQHKVWFVKIDHQQVGPYSLDELQAKYQIKELDADHRVRMIDSTQWLKLAEVLGHANPTSPNEAKQVPSQSSQVKEDLSALIHLKPTQDATRAIDLNAMKEAKKEAQKILQKQDLTDPKSNRVQRSIKILGFLTTILALLAGVMLYQHYFPSFPTITDISEKDYATLKNTARSNATDFGIQIAFALSTRDLNRPLFYIGSNAADGTEFTMALTPVEATLTQVSPGPLVQTVHIQKNYAQTAPFEYGAAGSVPIGEYLVEITSVTSTDKRPLFSEKYFLGGVKDEHYIELLKNHHQEIKAKALSDLQALKQITSQLSALFLTMQQSKVKALSNHNPRTRMLIWKKHENTYSPMFKRWLSDWNKFKEQYKSSFFAARFLDIDNLQNNIQSVNDLVQSSLNSSTDQKLMNVQIDDVMSKTQNLNEAITKGVEQWILDVQQSEGFLRLPDTTSQKGASQ